MHQIAIEWAPFRLMAGAARERRLRASAARQQEFLDGQTGFLRRDLLSIDERLWVDLLMWQDRLSAEDAMAKAMTSSCCRAYFALMVTEGQSGAADGVVAADRVATYGRQ
jgi:hypothetical protein